MSSSLVLELMEHNIPSIGPQTGLFLLNIARAIEQIPENQRSADLEEYRKSLSKIVFLAADHQLAVIQKLGRLVKPL